jgi:hypothetical protein
MRIKKNEISLENNAYNIKLDGRNVECSNDLNIKNNIAISNKLQMENGCGLELTEQKNSTIHINETNSSAIIKKVGFGANIQVEEIQRKTPYFFEETYIPSSYLIDNTCYMIKITSYAHHDGQSIQDLYDTDLIGFFIYKESLFSNIDYDIHAVPIATLGTESSNNKKAPVYIVARRDTDNDLIISIRNHYNNNTNRVNTMELYPLPLKVTIENPGV